MWDEHEEPERSDEVSTNMLQSVGILLLVIAVGLCWCGVHAYRESERPAKKAVTEDFGS